MADTRRALPNAFKDDLIGLVPRLRRYALSLTVDGNEADDLVQFTLLKAWEHRGRFEPGTSLVAWLFTILRNGFINGRRKRSREVPDPDGVHAAHPPNHTGRITRFGCAIYRRRSGGSNPPTGKR